MSISKKGSMQTAPTPNLTHMSSGHTAGRSRLITIILTAAMMAGEIAGGLISGSLALLSDAGHMLTHAFALLISFLAILYSGRPATKEKSFGFYRSENLLHFLTVLHLSS